MDAISRVRYNGSYTIAAKPIKTLELHDTMIQLLIISLYHSIENTANQSTGKALCISGYCIQPSHYARRECPIDYVGHMV